MKPESYFVYNSFTPGGVYAKKLHAQSPFTWKFR